MRATKVQRSVEYKDINAGSMQATNDAQGIVEGYLNTTGNVDAGMDRSIPGCFRKTIKDAFARKSAQGLDFLWPFLFNHDFNQLPPGGIFDADETSKGLYIKTQLLMDIQSGRELYASFRAGTVQKLSMGYKAIQVDYVKDAATGRTIRNLIEVAVMEGSCVVFPMNDESQVTAVKNRSMFPMPHRTLVSPTKDFDSRYQEQQLDDWIYSDWNDLATALHQSILDLFAPGGDPSVDLESQVVPQFIAALRQYVSDGVALGYTPSQDSQDAYAMMSLGQGQKSGYLSAAGHSKIAEASAAIMKHSKIIQSELGRLESSRARQRAADLQGYPLYSGASSSSYFEQKEDEEDARALLNTINTRLEVENDLRETREMNAELRKTSSVSAGVDAALSNLIASVNNKRR